MARAADANGRDRSTDGRQNQAELWLLTHLQPMWTCVQSNPTLERAVNGFLINQETSKMPYRPNPFSAMSDYTSWASLTDRTFSGRHLPPAPAPQDRSLPDVETVADLFIREDGRFIESDKSTVLFAYFAQWFTDGFLRSDRHVPPDPRKNDSNHEIDLMQVYGLTAEVTDQLRSYEGGELKSQIINGEEYPQYAYNENGVKKPEFSEIPDVPTKLAPSFPPEKLAKFFAVGSDTGNLQLGFVLMNVLFFREHNRVARLLAERYPKWDDDRLFETARNIVILLLIKIVVEEYVNHITPYHFKVRANPGSFRNPRWYRVNRQAVEFNLVYRWHQLVPNTFRVAGRDYLVAATLYETDLLTTHGLAQLMADAASQAAGRIGLFNTDPDLKIVQVWSIEKGRDVNLRSYNEYRRLASFPPVTSFDQISGDPKVQKSLRDVYGSVDRVEFYTGLYAEDVTLNSILPPLVHRMVGIDAFTQAFTNPLLAPRVFNATTFTELGLDIVTKTNTLADILRRNTPDRAETRFMGMTCEGWRRR